jgi:hypothetical protein
MPLQKARTVMRAASEDYEQASFFSRLQWLRPNLVEFVAAVANGGKRDKRTAARLKRTGVRRGFPDVVVMLPRQGAHALLIEFKRQGITQADDEQHALHALYRAQGYRVELCSGCDAAWRVFEEYVAS